MRKKFKKLVGITTAVAMAVSLVPTNVFAEEPEVAEPTEKKNNYDFLKTSQIYNKDQHKLKPQPIKQELDLTHLDQD